MTNRCAQCGTAFSSDALQGHCPRCLAGIALSADEATPAFPLPRSLGDYELLEEMGRGGMGVVYRARQKSLKREVAVKMILAGEFASAEFVRRFRHEATAAASLQHPNIVAIHEVGEIDGQHYFSMDLVDGKNLTELTREEPLDAYRAANYVKAIAEAIHYAHGKRILHRDLKPSNVLIDCFDQPRVLDFGLAREFQSATEPTRSGQAIGSPAYSAPEQALGKEAGPASDVYSLGAILYDLLTARPPFQGATLQQVILQVQTAEPITPRRLNPDVPEDLQTICLKCLEKEPARRYATARDLADDLGRFLAGEPVKARPIGATGHLWRWCKRQPAVASLTAFAGILLLALAVGGSVAAWRIERALLAEQQQRQKVVAAGARLEQANARLAETVTFLELQRAEGFFQAGDASMGLAQLAAALRRDPSNRVAAERILSALLHRNWVLPVGRALEHPLQVGSLAFTADGEYIATGCADGTARIWNVAERKELHRLQHPKRVRGVCFSPDQKILATACRDGKVRLWEWRQDRVVLEFHAHNHWVLGIVFSPDGTRLVSTSMDTTARIWNAGTEELVATLSGHAGWVWQAVFSPDGSTIATAGYDGSARLWNSVTGEAIGDPIRHRGNAPMLGVAFSPDGTSLATSSRDRTAIIWDLGRTATERRPYLEHPSGLNDVQFHPNGDLIATTGFDNSVRLWDAQTGAVVSQPFRHREQAERAAFSPDGRLLATASDDRSVKFWEVRPGEAIKLAMAHSGEGPGIQVLELSADGKLLATASRGVRLWNARSGEHLRTIDPGGNVQCASFSRDGRLIAIGTTNGIAGMWETQSGNRIAGPFTHKGAIWSIAFSVNEERLLTASSDRRACVWNIGGSNEPQYTFGHNDLVGAARYSPDGTRVVTVSLDHTARLWDAESGVSLTTMAHSDAVVDACFSRDGRFVVTASQDNTARIWEVSNGKRVGKPLEHLRSVHGVALSPDGRRIVTGSLDHTARIWDSATGEPLCAPMEHGEAVSSVCFSPDGARVLTTSLDGTARVWDAGTGLPSSSPLSHPNGVQIGRFSLDGESVITGARDNTARIWRVPSASAAIPAWLPDLAEAVAGLAVGPLSTAQLSVEEKLERVKAQVAAMEGKDSFSRVGRWFFAERGERTISPFDEVAVSTYVQRRIADNTARSLQEALRLDPTNALALARLAAIKLDTGPAGSAEAAHRARRALRFDPHQPEARAVLERLALAKAGRD